MPPQPPLPSGLSVLVADDLAEIRDVATKWLTARGYHVVCAASGNDAIHLIGHMRFDLVVADVLMPDGDGLDVIRELKSRPVAPPVLAISGGGEKMNAMASIMRADADGADAVLLKPFNAAQFIEAVEGVLRKARR